MTVCFHLLCLIKFLFNKNLQNYEAAKSCFMQNIFSFESSANLSRSQGNPHDLLHHRPNQTNFGTNGLRAFGPKIWNGLPNEMKSAQNISVFRRLIKQWDEVECNCNACQFKNTTSIKINKRGILELVLSKQCASQSLLN